MEVVNGLEDWNIGEKRLVLHHNSNSSSVTSPTARKTHSLNFCPDESTQKNDETESRHTLLTKDLIHFKEEA